MIGDEDSGVAAALGVLVFPEPISLVTFFKFFR